MKIKGNGSIEQLEKNKTKAKCRKWRLWVYTEQGRKSKAFNGTYTQAQNALDALISELGELAPTRQTFASYAQSWRVWRETSEGLSVGTLTNDKRVVKCILRSPLADMNLNKITPEDCRDALLWIKSHPQSEDLTALSNTSMNKVAIILKRILQQAEDDLLIPINPMAKIKPPRPDTKEKRALSPIDLNAFIDNLAELPLDGRVMALYYMALLGLRRSEACALRESDIKDGIAYICRAVKERDCSVGETKTESGKRRLPMPDLLITKTNEWIGIKRLKGWDDRFVCCNTEGGILRPQSLQRWWGKHRDALGAHDLTMHQLRHSNLSMMARYMSPFDLQHYAGWSSITPAKIYVHSDLDKITSAIGQAWSSDHILIT